MKKVRIMLTAIAGLFAVVAAFAAQRQSDNLVTAWEYVTSPTVRCNQVSVDCQEEGLFPCKIGSNPVGDSNTISGSMCGTQLRRDN